VQMESEVPSEPAGTSQRPSNVLVPRLLALFGSPYEDAKCLSVSIMNLLAGGSPSALAEHMDRSAALPPPPCCSVPLERQRLEASTWKSYSLYKERWTPHKLWRFKNHTGKRDQKAFVWT
jgi:hypothetical protein